MPISDEHRILAQRNSLVDAISGTEGAVWWAVVTLTTVGYGDVVPVTTGGRVFTIFMLAIGLGVIASLAGLVASAFSKALDQEDAG